MNLYPRTVDIHRVNSGAGPTDAVVGDVGYIGPVQSLTSPDGESVILKGVACSIQAAAAGRKKASTLPTDVVFAPTWKIMVPVFAVAKGVIRDRDILIDDEGYRYEVGQAYWNLLGYKLMCIRLEA